VLSVQLVKGGITVRSIVKPQRKTAFQYKSRRFVLSYWRKGIW